jgi:hypothetical protein
MAAYNDDEKNALLDEYFEKLRTGAPITDDFSKRLKDASIGVKGYTDAIDKVKKSFVQAGIDYGKSMYAGKQGMDAFNQSISGVSSAVEQLASILRTAALLIPGLRLLALGVTAIEGTVKAFKAAGEQSDKLFKTFQDLSRSGVATAQGMSEVFPAMQKFGYGLEELDKMVALIAANSKDLAQFSTTASAGIRQLSDTAAGIQRSGLQGQFMRMGMSVDDINKGIAGYLRLQGQLGQLQGRTQEQLTAGSAQYLREMEGLTRLTGQQREEMERQRDEANQIEIFYATVRTSGKAGEEMYKVYNMLRGIDPKLALGFANSVSGLVGTSDEASQLFMATSGALPGLIQQLNTGQINAAQFSTALGQASKSTEGVRLGLGRLGAGQDVYGSNLGLTILAQKDFTQGMADVNATLDANALGTDKLTAEQVQMRQRQMQSRDAMQTFINMGVLPATQALNAMAGAANTFAKMIPGTPGGGAGIGGGSSSVGGQLNRYGSTGGAPSGTQKEFYNSMYNTLLSEARAQGVPNPEVIAKLGAAQASLETGYGKRQVGNNYFGIKAQGGSGVGAQTQEFIGGKMVTVNDRFRGYGSAQESAADYIKFLRENPRYAGVLGAGNLSEAIAAQGRSGYATDPQYASKLANISGRFENMTSGMNPSAAISPDSQPVSGAPVAGQTDQSSIWQRIAGALENIENASYKNLNVNEKLLQMTQ